VTGYDIQIVAAAAKTDQARAAVTPSLRKIAYIQGSLPRE
jgi:hypothetical protein